MFRYYQSIQAVGPSRASGFINLVPVSGVFLDGWSSASSSTFHCWLERRWWSAASIW